MFFITFALYNCIINNNIVRIFGLECHVVSQHYLYKIKFLEYLGLNVKSRNHNGKVHSTETLQSHSLGDTTWNGQSLQPNTDITNQIDLLSKPHIINIIEILCRWQCSENTSCISTLGCNSNPQQQKSNERQSLWRVPDKRPRIITTE